jgi:hypothetical protein
LGIIPKRKCIHPSTNWIFFAATNRSRRPFLETGYPMEEFKFAAPDRTACGKN